MDFFNIDFYKMLGLHLTRPELDIFVYIIYFLPWKKIFLFILFLTCFILCLIILINRFLFIWGFDIWLWILFFWCLFLFGFFSNLTILLFLHYFFLGFFLFVWLFLVILRFFVIWWNLFLFSHIKYYEIIDLLNI